MTAQGRGCLSDTFSSILEREPLLREPWSDRSCPQCLLTRAFRQPALMTLLLEHEQQCACAWSSRLGNKHRELGYTGFIAVHLGRWREQVELLFPGMEQVEVERTWPLLGTCILCKVSESDYLQFAQTLL